MRTKIYWCLILEDAENGNRDVLESFKKYILLCRRLKRDETYKTVMQTVKTAIDDGLDVDDALDFAVDRRKFLILRTAAGAKREARLEGKEWEFM